ncbi:MAG TPA: hypothetical protein VK553_05065, partial [Candidatus Nitrosopolaris rasttigaisensis]|nr:hypothetical protein [Candidatus Nitrosopolaris rasttigaisensis]
MSDNPQSLHGGNEGGDGRGRYNREMPRRPRYDYLRLSLSNTRWERVNRLNTRIGTAEAWLDEQLRAHASLAHYSDRLDALTQTANIARPQSVQGNDRFINRSRDHDIRESGTRILQRTANQFEDLALEVLNERGQEHDQFTHTRISEHVKDA